MNQLAMEYGEHLSTQCQDVLRCIQERGYIDPRIALNDYGIMRLAARINDLKKQGYLIDTTMVTFTSRYGRKSAFARYSLS